MSVEPESSLFEYVHLPEHLAAASRPFGELAFQLYRSLPAGTERAVALRKLLEAKDAAVRAVLLSRHSKDPAPSLQDRIVAYVAENPGTSTMAMAEELSSDHYLVFSTAHRLMDGGRLRFSVGERGCLLWFAESDEDVAAEASDG